MREILGILLGFFLAAVLGYLISEIAQKEQEKEVLESYMDSFQEIYEIIQQRMDVTRKFRHDLLSHVQTLEYLIEKQKNPDGELRKYADQLTEEYRKIQRGTFCRDEITDAFLMMEKQVCTEKEIPFQIQVSKICMEWMMPVERIGFLHNLLDNAICAAAQAYPPEVYVRVRKTGEEYLLSVRNRVQRDVELPPDGQLPRTTRKEPGHGMGLSNVRDVLLRHGAEYTLSCRDNWFRFTCAFPTNGI